MSVGLLQACAMMNARHVSSMRMDKHTMGERKASASTRATMSAKRSLA